MAQQLTVINRAACKTVRSSLTEALELVEQELGVKISVGNARFSDVNVDFKVSVRLASAAPEREDAYNKFRLLHGLPELHTEFTLPGDGTYKIVGFKPRATKNNVIIANGSGKEYVCPAATVIANCN